MTMFGSEAIRLGKEIWGYYRETGIFFGGENKERWGQLGGATLGAGLSLGGAVVSGHMLGSMLKADGVLDKFRSGWGKSGVGAALEEGVGIETSYGKSSGNLTKTKGWKVGDPIDNLTKAGNEPSWSTVRARYWKNKAYYYADDYSESNLIRMRKGLAPIELETGASMELHHINGRDISNPHNIDNLLEVWPWKHAEIDPHRLYTGPRPKGE